MGTEYTRAVGERADGLEKFMDDKVLAIVAGEEVTEKDLDDFMENVPKEQQAYRTNPQFRQQCLEQLIALRMFTKLGEEEKLDETEEFKKIMEGARKDILAQMMISMTIKDIGVADEEAERYYESNKAQFAKGETVRAKHILTDTQENARRSCRLLRTAKKLSRMRQKSIQHARQDSGAATWENSGKDRWFRSLKRRRLAERQERLSVLLRQVSDII